SEDSDLLIGEKAVKRLLRGFGTPKACVYSSEDILTATKLSVTQLKQMACLAGIDYIPGGVRGIGLHTAYKLIKRYKYIEKFPSHVLKKYPGLNDEFRQKMTKAWNLF